MHRAFGLAAMATLAAGSAASQEIVGRNQSTYSVTHRLDRGDWVRIATPNGTVRIIEGRGTEASVEAEKVVRRGSDDDVGFVVRRGAGGLTVCAVFDDRDECDEEGNYRGGDRGGNWWRDHQIRINFTVTVPAGTRIKAGSGNGDVSIAAAGAEVIAASGNGRITVEGAAGPVEASSGNGDILIATSQGPVNATSGNGSIDVTMDRLTGSPDMEFTTGNGRISVAVPEGFGAELFASSGNGRIHSDFPIQQRGRINKSRVRGTLGDGGGRLTMTSGNGSLEVVRGRSSGR